MATLTPLAKVWTAADGSGTTWEPAYQSTNVDEAVAVANHLASQGAHVAVYERGRFQHNSRLVVGFVGFIWSDNLDAYMGRPSPGRGWGWTEDYDTFVKYEYPGLAAGGAVAAPVTTPPAAEVATAVMAQQYAQGTCEGCGVIASMHDLRVLERDVETGHSSGTTRTSSSYSTTRSSRGYSDSSRHGRSSTSGRRYYKRIRLLLCETCYAQQAHPVTTFLRKLFKS